VASRVGSGDPDAALVLAAQEGDATAFGYLYERYRDQVYRYCNARSRSTGEAEDLLGEVFLKAMESIGRYRDRGVPYLAYLYRIARNASIDRSRKPGEAALFALTVEPRSTQDVEADAARSMEMESVTKALRGLKDDYREVILLRFVEGYAASEVARLLDKSEKQIWNLQQRALERLRKELVLAPAMAAQEASS
jgi:RNA polymerase sigma-70 factor (ECF subfamily)